MSAPVSRIQADPNLPPWVPGELHWAEFFWRDNYKWLEEAGYRLRTRYSPDWIPSWKGTSKDWLDCEDGQLDKVPHLLDAIRIADGHPVMLKRINKDDNPHEIDLATFLYSEKLRSDPRNHSMPTYEILPPPGDSNEHILVMAFLRKFDNPPFETIGEVVDCFDQMFEGLLFMHELNVAHRDCQWNNIMMDPTALYPDLYHPMEINKTRDFRGKAKHFSRTQKPPRYYFVDFGLSRRYSPEDRPPLEEIIRPGDKSVPEHQGDAEVCDPFPTDVYLLGNTIRTRFTNTKRGFEFIQPLVNDMVQDDPSKRPTMDMVVSRFKAIRDTLNEGQLRSRVVDRREILVVGIFKELFHWGRRLEYTVRRMPPVPVSSPAAVLPTPKQT